MGGDATLAQGVVENSSRASLERRMLVLSKHLPVSFLASVVALLEKAESYL